MNLSPRTRIRFSLVATPTAGGSSSDGGMTPHLSPMTTAPRTTATSCCGNRGRPPQHRRQCRSTRRLRCPLSAPSWWCLHVVRVGTASVLVGGATGYPLRHPGRTSVPSAAAVGAEQRSWPSVPCGMTTRTRLVRLPQAVSEVKLHIALLASTMMAGNELRGGVRILGTLGSGLLGRKRRRGDASPRCLMDDARTAFRSSIGLPRVVSHRGACAATAFGTVPRIACGLVA